MSKTTFVGPPRTPPSTPSRFRALLRAVTRAAMASSVAGCSNDDSESGKGEWDPIACDQGYVSVSDAQTTRSVDYLAIYRQFTDFLPMARDGGAQGGTAAVAVMGSPCSGATDTSGCEAQLASITSCADACEPFAVVGSSGKLQRLNSRAELVKLLGDIDAVADAILLAIYDGHTVCGSGMSGDIVLGGQIRTVRDGYETRSTWTSCGEGVVREELAVHRDGKIEQQSKTMLADPPCAIGRRPFGLCEVRPTPCATRIGTFLAQAAHLEAASVYAFEKLVRELEAFGAPRALIEAAMDAIEDELAHARDVARLARAHGASTTLPKVAPSALRSKLDVALDNISEGCVRETFGAVVATHQAECATDPRVRAIMRQIAEDETRHASFSWQLQAWLASELSPADALLVDAAQQRAMEHLGQALDSGLDAQAEQALGFPSLEASTRLFHGLQETLWAGAGHRGYRQPCVVGGGA